eukprot:m.116402 g.116402  ORF g.116402 m.116402 type:complete len:838 (-) comp15517_c0_seq1:125-2638(-)
MRVICFLAALVAILGMSNGLSVETKSCSGLRDDGVDNDCDGDALCIDDQCALCAEDSFCGVPVCLTAEDYLYGPKPKCPEFEPSELNVYCPPNPADRKCRFHCGGIAGFQCPSDLTCVYGPECEGVSDCMGTCQKKKPYLTCPLAVSPEDMHYAQLEGYGYKNGCQQDKDCMTSGLGGEICAAEQIASIGNLSAPAAACQCVNNKCSWTTVCKEPICEPVLCDLHCEYGFALDRNGCETCSCNGAWVGCPNEKRCLSGDVVTPEAQSCCGDDEECKSDPECPLCGGVCTPVGAVNDNTCPLVFTGDEDDYARWEAPDADNSCSTASDCQTSGCNGEICAAESLASPCSTEFMPPAGNCSCVNNRCAWTEPCDEPLCEPVRCRLYCEHGWAVNETTGCEICACKEEEVKCCDPLKEPTKFGNPVPREGYVCCPNGEWGYSIGDASTFVCDGQQTTGPFSRACPLPCPEKEVCVGKEEAECCAKGEVCNNGQCVKDLCGYPTACSKWHDGCNDCEVDANGCLQSCTKRACSDLVMNEPYCKEFRVPDRCTSFFDGCNTCGVENGELTYCTELYCPPEDREDPKCLAYCCDPLTEPGMFGNPIYFEGHRCCPTTGEWGASIGDASTFVCGGQQTTGPFGEACPLSKHCRTREDAYRKTVKKCRKAGADKCNSQDDCGRNEECYKDEGSRTGHCCELPPRRVNIEQCLANDPKPCGGLLGLQCSPEQTCVDDPRDSCDPAMGGADCGGICCCQGKPCGTPQKNCDKKCKKLHADAKYYWHGEYTKDENNCDDRCKCEPCPERLSMANCTKHCAKRDKFPYYKTIKRNGVKCEVCKCSKKQK